MIVELKVRLDSQDELRVRKCVTRRGVRVEGDEGVAVEGEWECVFG